MDLPANYRLSSASEADIHTIVQIMTNQNMSDYGMPLISVDALTSLWHSGDFDPSRDTWIIRTADDSIVAYAQIEQAYFSIYLSQGLYDLDLKTVLLQTIEQANEKTNDKLITRISSKNQRLLTLLKNHDYICSLSFLMMEINLKSPPALPKLAEGVGIRPFILNQDEQQTYWTDEEASQDKGYYSPMSYDAWVERMRLHQENFDPTLWFVAHHQGEIVGVALNYYDKKHQPGWVDHLGVRRKWRQQGIGKALLLHSLNQFYQRDISHIRLNVDSGSLTNAPKLYNNVGMKTVQKYHFYHKTLFE